MFLAIDIGNTSIEFAFFNNFGEIVHKFFIASKNTPNNILDINELTVVSQNNEQYLKQTTHGYLSSVVPANNDILANFLKQQYNINLIVLKQIDFKDYITLNNRSIESVGMDILCKSFWVKQILKQNAIILDVGTASVVQYVKQSGELCGAGITIGLASIYKYLNSGTALLPNLTATKSTKVLGLNTKEAIEGGVYFGYIGLATNLIKQAIQETNCTNIYLTGGLSNLVFNDILLELKKNNNNINLTLDKNIIFYGIYALFNTKFKK